MAYFGGIFFANRVVRIIFSSDPRSPVVMCIIDRRFSSGMR